MFLWTDIPMIQRTYKIQRSHKLALLQTDVPTIQCSKKKPTFWQKKIAAPNPHSHDPMFLLTDVPSTNQRSHKPMFLETNILHPFYHHPACFFTFKPAELVCQPISGHLSSARPSSWCPRPWPAHRHPECAAVWDDFPPSLLWPNKEQRVTLSITHCNPRCFYVWTINKYLMTRRGNKSGGAIRRRPIQPAKQSFRLTKLGPSTRSTVHVANRALYGPETIQLEETARSGGG